MKNVLILTLLLLFNFVFGQKGKDCLIAYTDSTSGNALIGYKSLDGNIVIKAKYRDGSDTLCRMAIVLTADFEFIGIDKNDSLILEPYIYDNGPDYVEEGLFRYVENGKIGFADLDGQKIIKAKYDFATPFSEGLSEYSIGGEPIYEDGRSRSQVIKESGYKGLIDRYWTWGGEVVESGYLNRYGQEFREVTALKKNKREAWTKDGKHFLLNKEGRIIIVYDR
ncbi:WG repeat-containing protein [Riemerella anatipestifer]|nr:WG repeat-containing protein [Riemerella anatipestifer]MDY3325833.1 WG repeat-containing protein [Riemerella anatipestifer]MDY3354375.1 WG repeat-containing protein [Riemerella anatipestifer]